MAKRIVSSCRSATPSLGDSLSATDVIRTVVHGLDAPEGSDDHLLPRGSATLVSEQLQRLLDGNQGEREFGIKEINLTNEYTGIDRGKGSFTREIYLTEGIDHLRKQAFPLNEHAVRQLRDSGTWRLSGMIPMYLLMIPADSGSSQNDVCVEQDIPHSSAGSGARCPEILFNRLPTVDQLDHRGEGFARCGLEDPACRCFNRRVVSWQLPFPRNSKGFTLPVTK